MTFRLQRTASKSYVTLITVQYMCINTYSQRELSARALKFLLFVCCSYKIADVPGIYCLSTYHYAKKTSDYICQVIFAVYSIPVVHRISKNLEVKNL